jgi:aminopeptidase N
MRAWVQEHLYGNATVQDFLAHVERSTTAQARAVLESWLFEDEVPSVKAWDEQIAKRRADRQAEREARRKAEPPSDAGQRESGGDPDRDR